MSGTISTRWYFPDWVSDQNLRACSLGARGLWMDMLCIASANKGYVVVAGKGLGAKEIARNVGATEDEVVPLLAELEMNEVFSRDRRGIIYCRRMVRAEINRRNGRLGGNPNLLKDKDNPKSVKPKPKPLIPEPEPEPVFSNEKTSAPKRRREDDWPADFLDRFWALYPVGRKTGKKAVGSKLETIRRRGDVTFAYLMEGLQRYVDSRPDPQFTKAPEVWLNKGCWDDEHLFKGGVNGTSQTAIDPSKLGFASLGAHARRAVAEPGPERPAPEDLQPVNRR